MGAGKLDQQLAPLAGKFTASSVRVFGLYPVRPGDTAIALKGVTLDDDRLDLLFEVQTMGAPDLTISLWKAQGLALKADALSFKGADRVAFARTLDVKAGKGGLDITADGETRHQAGKPGTALELY